MPRRKYSEIYNLSVPIKKELDNGETSIYKLKFVDSFTFMPSSLSSSSNLIHKLTEGLHHNKCKDCRSCLEYILPRDS